MLEELNMHSYSVLGRYVYDSVEIHKYHNKRLYLPINLFPFVTDLRCDLKMGTGPERSTTRKV